MKRTFEGRFIRLPLLVTIGIGFLGMVFIISHKPSSTDDIKELKSERLPKKTEPTVPSSPPEFILPINNISSDDKMAAIIGDEHLSPEQTATKLMALAPNLEEEGQEKAVQYALMLAHDNQVITWIRRLTEENLPDKITQALFQHMLSMDEDIGNPLLAMFADCPTHPLCLQSRTILEGHFGNPPQGIKWSEWIKMKK